MRELNNIRSKLRSFLSYLIPALGLVLIVIVLTLIWFWETAGREHFLYEERLVLNQDIDRGVLIEESLLTYQSFEKSKIFTGAIDDISEIVGLESISYIPQGSLLHPRYFSTTEVKLAVDQYIIRIPSDWIYSMPNTLRRQDKVYLYRFGQQESTSGVLFETEVAYVKDSMNREIVSTGKRDRMDGTGIIAEVSVVLDLDEIAQLTEIVRVGDKIIILYVEGVE